MITLRRLFFTSFLVLALSGIVFTQTKKVTDLTADTAPTSDDLTMTVNDPGGTPANRKVTLANLFFAMAPWHFCSDAGASDTYSCSLSPVPGSYVTGVRYGFKANTANTGAATVNFNSIGAKAIKKVAGGITTDLADNDIRAGQWVALVYDGTNMQMQSQLGNAASGGTVTDVSVVTANGISGSVATSTTTPAITLTLGAITPSSANVSGAVTVATAFNSCSDAGSNDTYACSLSPAPAGYTTGQIFWFKANTVNTGAATVNFNSLGAKTIKKVGGGITTDLADNDIRAGQWVGVQYDGTNMQMQSQLGNTPTASPGASDTYMQYNNAGVLAGTSFLTKPNSNSIRFDGGANANFFEIKSNTASSYLIYDNGGLGIHSGANYGSNWGNATMEDGYLYGLRMRAVSKSGASGQGLLYFKTSYDRFFVSENNGSERELVPEVARVSTQFDKTNTTLADVTGLSIGLRGNSIYQFKAVLFVDADATGGQKYTITYSSSLNNIIYQINSIANSTSALVITSRQTSSGGSAGQAGQTGYFVTIEGHINTLSSGTLKVQFAQNAASGTSSVLVGSNLHAQNIP